MDLVELALGYGSNILELAAEFAPEDSPGLLVPE
jgi:hypothetical protein